MKQRIIGRCIVLEQKRIALALWKNVSIVIPSHTNLISGAHLFAASYGYGANSIHELLNNIFVLQPQDIRKVRKSVLNIGHTSGSDIMMGCKTVLEAWLKVKKKYK